MLQRLLVENLVLVKRAELTFGDGMTCLTGETGAGKTLLIQALGLVTGKDSARGMVGKFADEAYVEAEFDIPETWWQLPEFEVFANMRPSDASTLVIARRVPAKGPARAFAWGRQVPKDELAAISPRLVAIAGQHSQRALLSAKAQRELLDAAGSLAHHKLVDKAAAAFDHLKEQRKHLEALIQAQTSRAERLVQIEIITEHVASIDPQEGERQQLEQQLTRAKNHTQLVEALAGVVHGFDADHGPVDGLASMSNMLQDAAQIDTGLAELAKRFDALIEELPDIAREARSALDSIDEDVDLESIQQRLSQLGDLERRYGSIEAAVQLAEQMSQEREQLGDLDEQLTAARMNVETAQQAHEQASAALSASRQKLAIKLAKKVVGELAELGMADARMQIVLTPSEPARHGAERVEFLLAANPGQDLASLSGVASGGEMSRVALALQVALGVTHARTIVFDEIDAGIGGTTAHAVARRLRQLGGSSQVLCVTHLAQLAAAADHGMHIAKSKGQTSITSLQDEQHVLAELARMMGSESDETPALEHARVLREKAMATRR